jgi:c(7)-type cytochrome triheme protein
MKRKIIALSILFIMTGAGLIVFNIQTSAEDVQDSGAPEDIIYTKPVKAVIFSHKTHTGSGLSCDSCHTKLFEMSAKNAESKPDFVMKSLYEGKYCGACHAPKGIAFASNTQCARCHIGVKGMQRAEKQKAIKESK